MAHNLPTFPAFSRRNDVHDQIIMQQMDDVDAGDVGQAPRLIPNLGHRLLHVRCNAALGVGQRLVSLAESSEADGGEAKAASLPFRRLGRALVNAYVTGNYHEKQYSSALLSSLGTALRIKEVDMTALLLETLVEMKPLWKLSTDKAGAVIGLCLLIADVWVETAVATGSTTESDESKQGQPSVERIAAPGWLSTWVVLCGECLESMDSDSRQASKWLRRSSFKLGEYLLSCSSSGGGRSRSGKLRRRSPLQLMSVVHSWTEQGLLVALAGLFAYLSSAMGTRDDDKAAGHNQYGTLVALKTNLISLVDKRLLNSKTPVAQSTLVHLGDLFFARLTAADWSTTTSATAPATTPAGGDESAVGSSPCLEALVLRAMKKAPEGSAPVVAAILDRLGLGTDREGGVDLSGFIKEGAAVAVLRALKVGSTLRTYPILHNQGHKPSHYPLSPHPLSTLTHRHPLYLSPQPLSRPTLPCGRRVRVWSEPSPAGWGWAPVEMLPAPTPRPGLEPTQPQSHKG